MLDFAVAHLAKHTNAFYSVPMRTEALAMLASSLVNKGSARSVAFDSEALHLMPQPGQDAVGDSDDDAPLLSLVEPSWFQGAVRQFLFFKVVRVRPWQCVRQKVTGEKGLSQFDIIVAAHRVVTANSAEGHVTINALSAEPGFSPSEQTFVLSLNALPLESLLKLRSWCHEDELRYCLSDKVAPQLELDTEHALSDLLQDLMTTDVGDVALIDHVHPHSAHRAMLLERLSGISMVERAEGSAGRLEKWKLTENGKNSVLCCHRLQSPTLTLSISSDAPLEERSVWELVLHLERDGWRHKVCPSGQTILMPPYKDGAEKVWYTKAGADRIPKQYLLALAKGCSDVPHLAKSSVYTALLNPGKPALPKRMKKLGFASVLEDDLDAADALALAANKKRIKKKSKRPEDGIDGISKPPAKRRRKSVAPRLVAGVGARPRPPDVDHLAAAAASGSSDGSSDNSSSSSSSSGSSKSSSCKPCSGGSPASQPVQPGSASSSRASSKEPKSPGAQSRASLHSAPPLGEEPPAAAASSAASAAAPAPAAVRSTRTAAHTVVWGCLNFTPKFKDNSVIAWQVVCRHPLHGACNKTRSVNQCSSEDECIRMLKAWALLGKGAPDKETHKQRWEKVVQQCEKQRLPSMAGLDARCINNVAYY
jgi:hypothetical protein